MSDTTTTNNGIGFTGLLTIALIVLKLTHYIDWRWRWVLAPIWMTASAIVAVVALVIGVGVFCSWLDDRHFRVRN